MTKVIFKKEGDSFLAVFPQEPGTINVYKDCMCYAHIGQHSSCDIDYVLGLPAAPDDELQPLWNELKSIGYDDLKRGFHITHKDFEKRKVALYA
jgi:hypothetical protein